MYRQNKLKEELDRLRLENRRLELENVFLRERTNTIQAELYSIRLEMQNLNDTLMKRVLFNQTNTMVINKENDD